MTQNPDSISFAHLMYENRKFPPPSILAQNANLHDLNEYEKIYQRSITDGDTFWLEQARLLHWFRSPTIGLSYTWDSNSNYIQHRWFEDGTLNVSYNCLDRHLQSFPEKTAILWQGQNNDEVRKISYSELHREVCQFANALKSKGIKKGDCVCIYMPMIPEMAVAMLACARIGAIHSVVFGGFSAESLSHRINDCEAKLLVTADAGARGNKKILLKSIADEALLTCPTITNVIVVGRNEDSCMMVAGRDSFYADEIAGQTDVCLTEELNAEDPLFILYTSGSTGKPKGILHTQGGYLLHTFLSHKYIFDIKDQDIYWCTADLGWVTGHSYVIYGPLCNGATTVMFEGIPTYPDAGRFWQVIEKHKVTIFYTAPTAIRALIRQGEEWPNKYNLSSLRLLGTVGEPINPEAWMWYYEVIGKGHIPIVDTWWQTETGGIMITPLPGCHTLKPGSANRPFLGVSPKILRDDGSECRSDEGGSLCITKPWPGIARTMWGDHQRYIETYFKTFNNMYFTGDGCRKDAEGDYWLMGRIDDVVNISGHRLGTAEVESALVSHDAVAEAAVVPISHHIKGQSLYAFVTLVADMTPTAELRNELILHVKSEIGAIAVPEVIHFTGDLPKTRSGKIMRRVLRKIAEDSLETVGDLTSLADSTVIERLINEKKTI